MTEREFLRAELLKRLEQYLRPYKFKLNKSLAEFTQRTLDGWKKYQLIFLEREQGWEIKVGLLIRKNIVEDIFHTISGFDVKFQKNTPTIGTVVNAENESREYVFPLTKETEINDIAVDLYYVFKNIALPFFEKFDSIDTIEKAVNSNVDDNLLTGPIFKGTKGLILAKINSSEGLSDLISIYTKYYETFAEGYYLPEFNNLVELIKQVDYLPSNDVS